MKAFFSFLLCAIVLGSNAQVNHRIYVGNVTSDSSSCSMSSTYLGPILNSKSKIEIRFFIKSSFDNVCYTVLKYDKSWSATHGCYPRFNTDPATDNRTINVNVNLDTLFSKLVANNIFSLPDHQVLQHGKLYYDPKADEMYGEGMSISDGIYYSVEFKVGNQFRSYGYSNPADYAEFYTSSHELRDFTNITEIFEGLLR